MYSQPYRVSSECLWAFPFAGPNLQVLRGHARGIRPIEHWSMPWRIAREEHGLHGWLRQGKCRRRGRLRAPRWMQKRGGLLREVGIGRRGFQGWRCGVGGGLEARYGCGLFAELRGGEFGVSIRNGAFVFKAKKKKIGAVQAEDGSKRQ